MDFKEFKDLWFYNKCWGLEEIEISTFIFLKKKETYMHEI